MQLNHLLFFVLRLHGYSCNHVTSQPRWNIVILYKCLLVSMLLGFLFRYFFSVPIWLQL